VLKIYFVFLVYFLDNPLTLEKFSAYLEDGLMTVDQVVADRKASEELSVLQPTDANVPQQPSNKRKRVPTQKIRDNESLLNLQVQQKEVLSASKKEKQMRKTQAASVKASAESALMDSIKKAQEMAVYVLIITLLFTCVLVVTTLNVKGCFCVLFLFNDYLL